jgi:hypothetical protein
MHQRPCRLTIADKYYGGAPEIPQQNPAAVFAAIRQNLGPLVQKQAALAGKYGPILAQQDIGRAREFAPQYAGVGLDLTKQYAPQYQALNLAQMQRNIAGQPILAELNRQAQSDLAAGGQLTPEQTRDIQQQTRAGFAARGNVLGNQALGAELLNRDQYAQQRLAQRRQFGVQVQGLNLQQLSGLGGVAQMPNLAAYGAPGASYAPMTAALGATSGALGTTAPIVSDIFSSNQNAAANQAIAGANKSSGIAGGALSAVGSIAAAY